MYKNFQKSKIECYHSNPHTTDYISSIYFFYQIFILSQIQSHFFIHTPNIFYTSKFKLFDLKNPKIQSSQNPSWYTIPTQIELKEPKRSKIDLHLDYETAVHILLVKAACRWFGFACSNFARFFQKLPNFATSSNHPKRNAVEFVDTLQQEVDMFNLLDGCHWRRRRMSARHKMAMAKITTRKRLLSLNIKLTAKVISFRCESTGKSCAACFMIAFLWWTPRWMYRVCVSHCRKEFWNIKVISFARGFLLGIYHVSGGFIPFATILAYVLQGNKLPLEGIFVALALYRAVRVGAVLLFPISITLGNEMLVSFWRIQVQFTVSQKSTARVCHALHEQLFLSHISVHACEKSNLSFIQFGLFSFAIWFVDFHTARPFELFLRVSTLIRGLWSCCPTKSAKFWNILCVSSNRMNTSGWEKDGTVKHTLYHHLFTWTNTSSLLFIEMYVRNSTCCCVFQLLFHILAGNRTRRCSACAVYFVCILCMICARLVAEFRFGQNYLNVLSQQRGLTSVLAHFSRILQSFCRNPLDCELTVCFAAQKWCLSASHRWLCRDWSVLWNL